METLQEIDQKIAEREAEIAAAPHEETKTYLPFRPLADRVLIRRIEADNTTTDGGLLIPERYRQQSNKGEVVDVGQFYTTGGLVFQIPLAPGDRVLFGEYNAEKFLKDGEELLLVRFADIRGVEPLDRGSAAETLQAMPAVARA